MDDTRIRISRAQNGFIVEVTDPNIKKQNRNADLSKGGKIVPWRDPDVKFTFTTASEVSDFIKTNIGKMFPDDDDAAYSTAFKVASEAKDK